MTQPTVRLRPAVPADMAGVFEIHKYYTLETVITFKTVVTSEEEHLYNLKSIQSQHLPYLVAVLPDPSKEGKEARELVAGYTYCSGFRSGKAGYRHTVELSLFCHPEHRLRGIGTLLLNKLLEVVAHPETNKEWIEGGIVREEDRKIRHVIACMAIDETGRDKGYGLRKYYESFGFREVGHLSKVGHKFDRWYNCELIMPSQTLIDVTGSTRCTCSFRCGRQHSFTPIISRNAPRISQPHSADLRHHLEPASSSAFSSSHFTLNHSPSMARY